MQLLMEGVGGAQFLSVDQLRKSPDGGKTLLPLTESEMKAFRDTNLTETETGEKARCRFLNEARDSDGYLYVEGPFQEADKKNGNGRIYERGLWEAISTNRKLFERCLNGGAMGHMEHPKDGRTDLSLVSHLIVPIKENAIFDIDAGGRVLGRAKILNTTAGKNLQELFRGGARVGISSRGKGSTFRRGGLEYVARDYQWDTFDTVSTPSVEIAVPTPVASAAPAAQPSISAEPVLAGVADSAARNGYGESLEGNKKNTKATEATRNMSGLDTLKKQEARVREIAESLDGSDAIKLAGVRDELLEMQMEARRQVEQDPTLRDYADDLAGAAKEVRTKATAQLESLTDKSLTESVKKAVAGNLDEAAGEDVKSLLAKTHERMEHYRSQCQELAESENTVTRREYEASVAIADGLLKECKKFQAENADLKESLIVKEKELEELGEAITAEGGVVDPAEFGVLKERYEKSLLIIEELAQRIRSAQVHDRVEECIRQEPTLGRVRDVLLESKTVEEVNTKVGQMLKLLEGQMVYVPVKPAVPAPKAQSNVAATAASLLESRAQPPKPRPTSPVLAHRIGLIESIVKKNGAFRK